MSDTPTDRELLREAVGLLEHVQRFLQGNHRVRSEDIQYAIRIYFDKLADLNVDLTGPVPKVFEILNRVLENEQKD